jgi:hypothetical protein
VMDDKVASLLITFKDFKLLEHAINVFIWAEEYEEEKAVKVVLDKLQFQAWLQGYIRDEVSFDFSIE